MKTKTKLIIFILILTLAGLACTTVTRGLGISQSNTPNGPAIQVPELQFNNSDPAQPQPSEDQSPGVSGSGEVQTTVLESRAFLTDMDTLYVIGMIENTGSAAIDFVKVVVSLRDEAGTLVTSEYGYAMVDIIQPGMRSPFSVIFYEEPDNWADYDIQVEADLNEYWESYTDFEIISDAGKPDDFFIYEINGELRNSGSQKATFIQVIAAFYDASGKMIGADLGYTDIDTLQPGGTSPFSVTPFAMEDGAQVASYELWVEGTAEE